jgi:hypothetical protein
MESVVCRPPPGYCHEWQVLCSRFSDSIMPVRAIADAVFAALATLLAYRIGRSWWQFSGRRVISCPETAQPAGVTLNALRAAFSSLVVNPSLRLSDCSRWPERAGCGQECLRQIETSPDGCLVRHIIENWYEGKSCAACGQPIGRIPLAGSKPALLLADRTTAEWENIPAERLAETLASSKPVCFGCHMAQTLVREHPHLVVDREGR